VAFKGIILY